METKRAIFYATTFLILAVGGLSVFLYHLRVAYETRHETRARLELMDRVQPQARQPAVQRPQKHVPPEPIRYPFY